MSGTRLADYCSSIDYGYTASASDLPAGPRFLRITDIVAGPPQWEQVPYCDADDKVAAKFRLNHGDIVVARTGATTGVSSYISEPPPAVFASYLVRLVVDGSIADARFTSYYLKGPQFWGYMRGVLGDKSAQPNASAKTITQAPAVFPPIDEQRAIAGVLGALDDKIEQNRRTAQALERLARSIFRAWFVDFEPVKAKAAGATAFPSMPQEVFDTLPTSFVDSDIGPVPEGWEVKAATEVAAVGIGKTPPRKEPHWFSLDPADVRWVSIKDMGQAGTFIGDTSEYLTEDAVQKCRIRRIPDESVLFSFKLTVGRVAITDGEMTSNEAIAHFVPNSADRMGAEYLYCYLSDYDHAQLGSTSSIATATNSKAVKAMPVIVPAESLTRAFTSIVRPSFQLQKQIGRESSKLAEMRDYLLPKLLSGQVRVESAHG